MRRRPDPTRGAHGALHSRVTSPWSLVPGRRSILLFLPPLFQPADVAAQRDDVLERIRQRIVLLPYSAGVVHEEAALKIHFQLVPRGAKIGYARAIREHAHAAAD